MPFLPLCRRRRRRGGAGRCRRRCSPARLLLIVIVICAAIKAAAAAVAAPGHPDTAGLLALAASVCGTAPASLSSCGTFGSWPAAAAAGSDPCSWQGVDCADAAGSPPLRRVVGVHTQLPRSATHFNDGSAVVGLPHLRELELLCVNNNNGSSGESDDRGKLPRRWLEAYPQLRQLRVVGCGAGGALPAPEALRAAPHLSYVVLRGNRLRGPLGGGFFAALPRGIGLLDLSNNLLTGSLPATFEPAAPAAAAAGGGGPLDLPRLQYLYLSGNQLDVRELPCVWATGALPSLKLLDVSGQQPKEGGCANVSSGSDSGSMLGRARRRARRHWQLWRPAALGGAGGGSSGGGNNGGSGGSSWGASRACSSDENAPAAAAPRCWLRAFCVREGVFVCLARGRDDSGGSGVGGGGEGEEAAAGGGGCTRYIYGSSDLHMDPLNQCDHAGAQFAPVAVAWLAFAAALLLIWLHHCRALRAALDEEQRGPRPRGRGVAAGAGGGGGGGGSAAWAQQRQYLFSTDVVSPLASPRAANLRRGGGGHASDVTLPLLYNAAATSADAAGYDRPASPAALASAHSGSLPCALAAAAPPAELERAFGGGGGAGGRLFASQVAPHHQRGGVPTGAAAIASAGAAAGRGSSGGGGGFPGAAVLVPGAFWLVDVVATARLLLLWGFDDAPQRAWPSYALAALLVLPHALVGAALALQLLGAAALPPALKAAASPFGRGGDGGGGGGGGIGGNRGAPRLLPPGGAVLVRCFGALLSAPGWVSYPLLLVLLLPSAVLCAAMAPAALVTSALARPGLVDGGGGGGGGSGGGDERAARYVRLLQRCAALSASPAAAGLLTALFALGNTPLTSSFLDAPLFFVALAAALANIAAALALALAGRRRAVLAAVELPPAGAWS